MKTKTYAKTYAAPARRNIIAVGAFQRSGAGVHVAAVRPGPSVDEWDYIYDGEQEEPLALNEEER